MPVHTFCTIFIAPKMYKDMADKKENAMGDGIPARLRGLDVNGNSISPTLEKVMDAMGFKRYVYELIDGQELSLETTDSGLYIVYVSYYAYVALYIISPYTHNSITSYDSRFFGNFVASTDLKILFGRKVDTGVLYIKNNSGQKVIVNIKKITI